MNERGARSGLKKVSRNRSEGVTLRCRGTMGEGWNILEIKKKKKNGKAEGRLVLKGKNESALRFSGNEADTEKMQLSVTVKRQFSATYHTLTIPLPYPYRMEWSRHFGFRAISCSPIVYSIPAIRGMFL